MVREARAGMDPSETEEGAEDEDVEDDHNDLD